MKSHKKSKDEATSSSNGAVKSHKTQKYLDSSIIKSDIFVKTQAF